MLDHLPTPVKTVDGKRKIYATPVPTESESEPESIPSPKPPTWPLPLPSPTATPGPWSIPSWSFPMPSTQPPSPRPPVKPTTTWPPATKPSPAPSPKPIGTGSNTPTTPSTNSNSHGEVSISTDLFTIFTRAYGQAFGVYDDGHLEQPDSIPPLGQGFLKIFQDRNRGYGSLDLLSVIQAAAKEIHRDIPAAEVLQIGDVAAKTGGQLGGHASHQNGLDADIVYFKKDHRVMPTTGSSPGATGFDVDFVDRKGGITSNFDIDANWRFIQILSSTNRIDRIFADQTIKREFCRYAVAKGMRGEWKETLRKIRHWPNHQDHMHVRLTCPPNSKKCEDIPAIPEGDGCDNLLDRTGSSGGAIIRMDAELLLPNEHGSAADHGC